LIGEKEKKIQGGDFASFFRRLEVLLVTLFMTTCSFLFWFDGLEYPGLCGFGLC